MKPSIELNHLDDDLFMNSLVPENSFTLEIKNEIQVELTDINKALVFGEDTIIDRVIGFLNKTVIEI